MQQLIVPIDGSPESWKAFDVALSLARRCDATVKLVEVIPSPFDESPARARLIKGMAKRGRIEVKVTIDVPLLNISVASAIEELVERDSGSIVVMASHGRGRSAAIVGSVADEILQRTFGPIMLVGPKSEADDFSGAVIATVDGSEESQAALPLTAAWATELRSTPWIVNVTGPSRLPADQELFETAYTSRLAHDLQMLSGHPVQFDELHGTHAGATVAEYASSRNASLIVASSHGRSGWSRLTMGSVTAELVRNAPCPVLVIRLPRPPATLPSVERWAQSH